MLKSKQRHPKFSELYIIALFVIFIMFLGYQLLIF